MTTQHTQGQWTVNGQNNKKYECYVHSNTGRPYPNETTHIATVKGETIFDYEANARLIAAAPDLLEALERSEAIIKDHVNGVERSAWPEVLAAVSAVIAKAKGEA